MATINRLMPSLQHYSQLSQYVTVLQSCMIQHGNQDAPEAKSDFSLKQEKQISRQGLQSYSGDQVLGIRCQALVCDSADRR